MKRYFLLAGLMLITKLCFSQISVGAGYVNNHNADRKYSKTLNGIDVDLKYIISDRLSLSSGFILYQNVRSTQLQYKSLCIDLNVELNVIKKEKLSFYCILGLDFQKSTVTALDPAMIDPSGNGIVKRNLFRFNLGLGAQYNIIKNAWLGLNILKNSDNEFIINPGLSYRFKFKGTDDK